MFISESQQKKLRSLLERAEGLDDLDADEAAFLGRLREAIDSSDWSKIGAVLGVLWYKLDRMIQLRSDANRTLQNIERNTK